VRSAVRRFIEEILNKVEFHGVFFNRDEIIPVPFLSVKQEIITPVVMLPRYVRRVLQYSPSLDELTRQVKFPSLLAGEGTYNHLATSKPIFRRVEGL
jgi:hypothetical protein